MIYKKHVFFCTNQRNNGKKCCQNSDADSMRNFAKDYLRELHVADVRVNQAGCLGQCEKGPNIVIYPEGTWYTYRNQEDVKEILDEHVINNRIVDRLLVEKSNA